METERSANSLGPACTDVGARVRSKRRGQMHGTIVCVSSNFTSYPLQVRWDNGDSEWCRAGELRDPNEGGK